VDFHDEIVNIVVYRIKGKLLMFEHDNLRFLASTAT